MVFYEKLIATYRAALGHDNKIVLGDFNANVVQETMYHPTIGKHSLHESTNENRLRLIDCGKTWSLSLVIHFPT